MSDSIADRARLVADKIEILPDQIIDTFEGGRPSTTRIRLIQQVVGEISVLALPIASWLERRTHPAQATLWKRRFHFVSAEPVECVRADIPEYANGMKGLANGLPGDTRSPGVHRTAEFGAFCLIVAPALRDLAHDIQADEHRGEATPTSPVPPSDSAANWSGSMLPKAYWNALRLVATKLEWSIDDLLKQLPLGTLRSLDLFHCIEVKYSGIHGVEKAYSPTHDGGGRFAAAAGDEWTSLADASTRSRDANPRIVVSAIGHALLDVIIRTSESSAELDDPRQPATQPTEQSIANRLRQLVASLRTCVAEAIAVPHESVQYEHSSAQVTQRDMDRMADALMRRVRKVSTILSPARARLLAMQSHLQRSHVEPIRLLVVRLTEAFDAVANDVYTETGVLPAEPLATFEIACDELVAGGDGASASVKNAAGIRPESDPKDDAVTEPTDSTDFDPSIIPAYETSTGAWVRARRAAKLEGIETRTLATYRSQGRIAPGGMCGIDPDGRMWRRIGTATSHPWYFKPSLSSQNP